MACKLSLLRFGSILLALTLLAACQSTPKKGSTAAPLQTTVTTPPATNAPTAAAAAPTTNAPAATPSNTAEAENKIKYSPNYDTEIKEIFALAEKNSWEEAEQRAQALYDRDKKDGAAERLLTWVRQQREDRRAAALEDKIREIDAKNSVFNPTIPSLLTEKKDRGLPPRKDVRDAIEKLEAEPYIPSNFNTYVRKQGLLFDMESTEGRMAKVLEKEISVHLDNVTLETIIFKVGQTEGVNFIADKALPSFKQTLSVNMDNVKLSEFLNYVSRNMELQFQVGDDLIWVVDGKDPKKIIEETRFYRLKHGFILPAAFGATEVVRTQKVTPQNVVTDIVETSKIQRFVNDNAPQNPMIEQAIKAFFTGSKYLIDYERNLLVATGTRDQLGVMDKIVQEFDKPLQQVLIEAKFITITEAAFMQLGASWETGRGNNSNARTPTDYTGLGTDVGLGLQESFTNVLSRPNLSATITALQQSGESQTLSSPRLTVVNNLPATISDGKIQYYYEEYTVKQTITERSTASSLVPTGKPAKITSGVSLDVLASIGGDGRSIMLALKPQVNQEVKLVTFATVSDLGPDGKVASTFEIKLPETRTQDMATRVLVQSGQTVVMGGVMEREQRTFVESVPVLGSIPIIGAAFRKRTEVDRPRYLLIFVTATLLSETGEFVLYDEPRDK